MFAYAILAVSLVGLVVNVTGLLIIGRKKPAAKSMFHDLLMILLFFDFFVVLCAMMQVSERTFL